MPTIEEAIINLTTETTALLDAVNISKLTIESNIAAAVLVSTNAAIEPLFVVSTNLINTQALLVTFISL
jgi:hypothetical protein